MSSQHLLSLINDVLEMSRIESGKVQLAEAEISLLDLMNDLYTFMAPQAASRGQILTVNADGVLAMQEAPGTTRYENQAPAGQQTTEYRFEVMNNPGVELPYTGGPGTVPIYLLGFMLIGLGGAWLVVKRKKVI